jgi:hypothetical protein
MTTEFPTDYSRDFEEIIKDFGITFTWVRRTTALDGYGQPLGSVEENTEEITALFQPLTEAEFNILPEGIPSDGVMRLITKRDVEADIDSIFRRDNDDWEVIKLVEAPRTPDNIGGSSIVFRVYLVTRRK